ncbi:2-amino-4-hydroxy-6-hydroxymethyldihydropteridine diphosphokinase [Sagittula sp. M10.9X]|uniref:2-amino-4-hydroxy-6-hydroxymethyldihydropteridine pyrophosphokinase n=2 Tax=Sagittula salina TaxID=2820268 RepID=A0A940MVJ9_9RHOB|nr:2-amino-4-hydroxy-6-hydroxymethyldihydropteridine diphosphokinase [Sagittula salina]MBP0483689.1 2-amino-4-hydroxy-6-hydroxymethyldihydropteridine diphosphokinase [Sagittula salina]
MAQEYLIALGSNLGSDAGGPEQTIAAALRAMPSRGIVLRRVSRFFATPCFPAGTGPDYVNACAAVRCTSGKETVNFLHKLHEIEADFGRARAQRWGSRTLDLDLLAAGDEVLPDRKTWDRWHALPAEDQKRETPDRLILPHPRLHERAFVLVPLNDVASHWMHPALRQTVAELAAALPEPFRREVVPIPNNL